MFVINDSEMTKNRLHLCLMLHLVQKQNPFTHYLICMLSFFFYQKRNYYISFEFVRNLYVIHESIQGVATVDGVSGSIKGS